MKKLHVFFSMILVLCLLACITPLRGQASAQELGKWYEVEFTPVKNVLSKEGVPLDRPTDSTFSFYYNQWAKTLVIRGTGEMPAFDEKHPAPWKDWNKKAERVILERNITTVSAYAFEDFYRLKSVVLPRTLKSIDPNAFLWSDEVRKLKDFQKLEKLEFSGDLDDLDEILHESGIKELIDAKVIKRTEKEICDEIFRLTWYQCMMTVEYDKAGRPVRIIRVDENGYTFDTMIQYVSGSEKNTRSATQPVSIDAVDSSEHVKTDLTRDVVEKDETLATSPDGGKGYSTEEYNDLGQETYAADVRLDAGGRKNSGTQSFAAETGVYKTGILNAVYASDGSGTLTWNNTYWGKDGKAEAFEKVVEQILASGKVASITTTKTDTGGNPISTSTTNNTYDSKTNRLTSSTTNGNTTTYTYDSKTGKLTGSSSPSGNETFTYDSKGNLTKYEKTGTDPVTVTYTYDGNGLKTGRTETASGDSVVTSYNGSERASKETVTIDGVTYNYEYSYQNDVVSARTVKDSSGNVIGKDTFNAEGYLVQSVRKSGSTITTMSYSYDSSGRLIKTNGLRTVSAASEMPEGALTDEGISKDFKSREEIMNAIISNRELADTIIEENLLKGMDTVEVWSSEYDMETGNTSEMKTVKSAKAFSLTFSTIDSSGKVLSLATDFKDEEGVQTRSLSTFEYDEDGNCVETVKDPEAETENSETTVEESAGEETAAEITEEKSEPEAEDEITDSDNKDEKPAAQDDDEESAAGTQEEKSEPEDKDEVPDPDSKDEKPAAQAEVEEPAAGNLEEKSGPENEDEVPDSNNKDEKPAAQAEVEEPAAGNLEEKPDPKDEDEITDSDDKDEKPAPEVKEAAPAAVTDTEKSADDGKEEKPPVDDSKNTSESKQEPAPEVDAKPDSKVTDEPKPESKPDEKQSSVPTEAAKPAEKAPTSDTDKPAQVKPAEAPVKKYCPHCHKELVLDAKGNCIHCGLFPKDSAKG